DGIRDFHVTGVQTCALPIFGSPAAVVPPSVGSLAALAASQPASAGEDHPFVSPDSPSESLPADGSAFLNQSDSTAAKIGRYSSSSASSGEVRTVGSRPVSSSPNEPARGSPGHPPVSGPMGSGQD